MSVYNCNNVGVYDKYITNISIVATVTMVYGKCMVNISIVAIVIYGLW